MSASESANAKDANDSGFAAKNPAKRSRALLIVGAIFVLAALTWLLLWIFVFSTRETTDNAYVNGYQVALSSQVAGTVTAIMTDDTQRVEAGQVLVKLDTTDADVRLRQTGSALAQAVRQVREQTDTVTSADATVAAREVDLRKAQADLKRHLPLVPTSPTIPRWCRRARIFVPRGWPPSAIPSSRQCPATSRSAACNWAAASRSASS
jgi:membrane fusion protein (multidrug efflux system)